MINNTKKEEERIIGMEAYKKGLILWIDNEVRRAMKSKDGQKMNDFYIGKLNAYKEIEDHIKGNLRNKPKRKS